MTEATLNVIAMIINFAALVILAFCVVSSSRPDKIRQRGVEFGGYVVALILLTVLNVPAASVALTDLFALSTVWSAAKTAIFSVMMVRTGICVLSWYGQREALRKEVAALQRRLGDK